MTMTMESKPLTTRPIQGENQLASNFWEGNQGNKGEQQKQDGSQHSRVIYSSQLILECKRFTMAANNTTPSDGNKGE